MNGELFGVGDGVSHTREGDGERLGRDIERGQIGIGAGTAIVDPPGDCLDVRRRYGASTPRKTRETRSIERRVAAEALYEAGPRRAAFAR